MSGPPRALTALMTVTDVAFLLYWFVSVLDLAGVISLPRDWLYANHDDPRVAAWNWSFLPLDLALSVAGLAASAAGRRGDARWRPLALASLVLTQCAGGMAVGYWTLLREFDPAWFLPNLFLLLWPIPFLPGLLRPAPVSQLTPSSGDRGPSS